MLRMNAPKKDVGFGGRVYRKKSRGVGCPREGGPFIDTENTQSNTTIPERTTLQKLGLGGGGGKKNWFPKKGTALPAYPWRNRKQSNYRAESFPSL